MSEQRVVKPRPKTAAAKVANVQEETSPGDVIELGLTVEVTGKRGAKTWAKVGLSSCHRPNETSVEAQDRIQSFVIESLDALIAEVK